MIKNSKQTGISLVEVLVALVISLFLLGGIVQVYTGNKQTFAFTSALAEIQENGRFALDTMSQDLRLTGTWGCIAFDPTDPSNVNNTINGGNYAGYDNNFHDFTGQPGIEGTNNNGLNGSDSLTVRGGKTGQRNVEGPFTAPADQRLFTDTVTTIAAGDIVLVARCGANDLLIDADADILPVTGVTVASATQSQINFGANKSQQFGSDATIIELQTVTYTIANGASGLPALWRNEGGVAQELVEGVEEMQVLYGVDTDVAPDGFANQYVTADAVADWNTVVAVRVGLLVQSIDDFVAETPQTYTFNGATVTPADRRIRQIFSTTIALRNRVG